MEDVFLPLMVCFSTPRLSSRKSNKTAVSWVWLKKDLTKVTRPEAKARRARMKEKTALFRLAVRLLFPALTKEYEGEEEDDD